MRATIDFRGETDMAVALSLARDKDVRIVELLNANTDLVYRLRDLRRRFRRGSAVFYVHGVVMGFVVGVIGMGAMMVLAIHGSCPK